MDSKHSSTIDLLMSSLSSPGVSRCRGHFPEPPPVLRAHLSMSIPSHLLPAYHHADVMKSSSSLHVPILGFLCLDINFSNSWADEICLEISLWCLPKSLMDGCLHGGRSALLDQNSQCWTWSWSWNDRWVLQSTRFSCRGSGFESQQLQASSQVPVSVVPENWTLFSGLH